MNSTNTYALHPVGFIHSELTDRKDAPKQGQEGAPEAWVEVEPEFAEALDGIAAGDEIILLTWLDQSNRDVLQVHPRSNPQNPQTGVFATRSPNRPNPIGLHRVQVLEKEKSTCLKVFPLEAIDGTPVVDIKPVIFRHSDTE